jgi:hypothetical protein
MKNRYTLVFILILLSMPLWCYADAPVETYYFERSQIPDDILRETKGVLTISIIDTKAYTEYYNQSVIKDMPYISIFKKGKNSFEKIGVLDKVDIRTPTGGQYGPSTWYRFPVTNAQGVYLEIIYNLPKRKKCWVDFSELKLSLSPEKPVLNWFTNQYSSETVSVDIFYLTRDNVIKLYDSPSLESSSHIITPQSEILTSYGAYDVRALQIIERMKGFGHLVENIGLDRPPRSIGWIRLRNENGLLMVWPIMGAS